MSSNIGRKLILAQVNTGYNCTDLGVQWVSVGTAEYFMFSVLSLYIVCVCENCKYLRDGKNEPKEEKYEDKEIETRTQR